MGWKYFIQTFSETWIFGIKIALREHLLLLTNMLPEEENLSLETKHSLTYTVIEKDIIFQVTGALI